MRSSSSKTQADPTTTTTTTTCADEAVTKEGCDRSSHHRHGGAAVGGGVARNSVSDALYDQNYVWLRSVNAIDRNTQRPTARRGATCYVSDRFKFVFHHVLKNGGSTIMVRLKLGIGETIPGHKPGEPWPGDMHKRAFTSHDKSWLRRTHCSKAVRELRDYVHFAFVRDPYSRLRSIQAFATHLRRPEHRAFPRPIPSLDTLATSSDPEGAFRGATTMEIGHAMPQSGVVASGSGWVVDFVADIRFMREAFQDHLVPVLKQRLAGTGVDTTPLDNFAAYFGMTKQVNVMKKKEVDLEEEERIRCLLYKSPVYRRDYELFYTTHERKRRQAK
ncbi:hypothetical protein PTSG_00826 [Salpingoeca rosetta]|uniref:Uncharacterized protein n=1 Tax=Salpingoeca rosetta (strain ATCC 50818 / BSB-021) TaxID=946362 RepID=F2TXK9_SALR5|nr:uncharacterized protein PTSG_00826 [Salpingoeca rosetta]EGD76118.1 hypothetical protein PTSG_00826 [Salpingoeca rosetta]|eukprot:XP_004998293.1 hypothetical protein PTSG_00826 [Salpingoeca rosetta]